MNEDSPIRSRIRLEDQLLNSRTTIFLATNGLWIAAVGLSKEIPLRVAIAALSIVVSVIWVVCGLQSRNVIRELTKRNLNESSEDEKIVRESLWKPSWYTSPTDLLAIVLPRLFLLIWIFLIVWMFVCLLSGEVGPSENTKQ